MIMATLIEMQALLELDRLPLQNFYSTLHCYLWSPFHLLHLHHYLPGWRVRVVGKAMRSKQLGREREV